MRRLDGCSLAFLNAAALHVGGLYLTGEPVPYAGALAVVALAGLIWSRPLPRGAAPWTRYRLLAGLALLASSLALPDRSGLFAEALTAAACAAIGLGVLGRAGRLLRWANLPAIGCAVLVLGLTADAVRYLSKLSGDAPPDTPARAAAVLLPTLAVVMIGLAANAALTSRGALRWAGAGLLPVLILSITVLPSLLADSQFTPPALYPSSMTTPRISFPAQQRDLRALLDRQVSGPPGLTYSYPSPTTKPPAPPLAVAAARSTVDDLRQAGIHPWPAFNVLALLLGLATIATSLFPFRR